MPPAEADRRRSTPLQALASLLLARPVRLAAGLLAALAALAIARGSLEAGGGVPAFPGSDKLIHAGAYAVLAGLAMLATAGRRGWPVWLTATLFGGVLEIAQGVMGGGREASLLDAVANGAGALAAVLGVKALIALGRR